MANGAGYADQQMHPFFLTFTDTASERRYFDYLYVKSGFYGGQLTYFAALAFWANYYIAMFGLREGWTTEMFTGNVQRFIYIPLCLAALSWVLIYVDRMKPWREIMFLVTFLFHGCMVILVSLHGMGSKMYEFRMAYVFFSQLFIAVVAQVRFSRMFWLLSLVPIPTVAISTYVSSTYWDTESKKEIYLWALLGLIPFTLWPFERESRRAFVGMEKCENEMKLVESKSERTRSLLVNFFAPTPTRDFLATAGASKLVQKQYRNVVMVVTDLAGFTSWTSSVDATTASENLAQMFDALDVACDRYGIEKVSTVGDSFQGASFPSQGAEGPVRQAERALAMLEFSVDALSTFTLLQMRIGVHIGDITAAFIGNSPPKFDLFGEDFEVAKQLEADGVPGRVHASKAVMDLVGDLLAPNDGMVETPSGMVLRRVAKQNATTAKALEVETGAAEKFAPFDQTEMRRICQSLMRLGGVRQQRKLQNLNRRMSVVSNNSEMSVLTPSLSGSHSISLSPKGSQIPITITTATTSPGREGDPLDPGSSHVSLTAKQNNYVNTSEVSSLASMDLASTSLGAGGVEYQISEVKLNWWLTFIDPADEARYKEWVKRSGIVRRSNTLVLLVQVALLIGTLFLGCVDTLRNRLLVAHAVFVLNGYMLVDVARIEIPHWTGVTLLVHHLVPGLVAFIDASCDPYVAAFVSCLLCFFVMHAVLSINFMFHLPLLMRAVGIALTSIYGALIMIVRHYGLEQANAPVDTTWLLVPAVFCFMSIAMDFNMRMSFAADRRLRLTLRRLKHGMHRLALTAVDIMVPQFVSERMIEGQGEVPTADLDDIEANLNGDEDEGPAADGGADLLDRDRSVPLTWEFDRLAVMFVSFETSATTVEASLDAMSDTFKKLERILASYGVQKIKSIGSTLLCAHGMSSEKDPAFVQLQAASQMVQRVLRHEPVTSFRIGVHVGPAFGAVMGRSSILFDVFGDSVNMASRMASTAAPKTIQLSESVHAQCSHHSVLRFERNNEVMVKGKGRMTTYTLTV